MSIRYSICGKNIMKSRKKNYLCFLDDKRINTTYTRVLNSRI
jgi:hypothetical protein